MTQEGPKIAPALERGLSILEIMALADKPVGFNEIAAALLISRASTARLLRVLRERGYVVKDKHSGKYRTGPKMAILGQHTAITDMLRRESEAILKSLVEITGNTALVIYWTGNQMQCVAKQMHRASIPMQRVGTIETDLSEFPWGWIFYESLDRINQENALKQMADSNFFMKRIEEWLDYFHKHGYIYDDQQIFKSVRRFGTPVFDLDEKIVGALGIGGNPITIPDAQVKTIGQYLVLCAQKLSTALGWRSSKKNN